MKTDAKAGRLAVVAAIVGWAMAGCGSVEPDAVRRPAMPTVGARTETAGPAMSAAEKLAAARQAAGKSEFARAVELLSGDDAAERARLVRELTAELAARDPVRAVGLAEALPASAARTEALEIGARAWAKREGDAALRWALELTEAREGSLARRVVADERVAVNAREAIDRLMALPAGAARDETLGFAAAAWTRREPERAVEWVRGLADGELKMRLVASVGFELAQSNPGRAMELAETLPAGRNRWLLTGALAQTWVVKDPKAAFAWAKGLPAGEARDAAHAGFDTALGVPTSRRVAGGPNTRTGMRTRGGTGAGAAVVRDGDLPSFDLWLRGQRAGMSRDEAILEYVRQRGAAEPRAIGQWLTTLPAGTTRDRATEIYVENMLAVSPREAASFLRTLPRSEQTPEMLERTAKRLLITDPAAAETWIQQSALPEFRKQELLREARR